MKIEQPLTVSRHFLPDMYSSAQKKISNLACGFFKKFKALFQIVKTFVYEKLFYISSVCGLSFFVSIVLKIKEPGFEELFTCYRIALIRRHLKTLELLRYEILKLPSNWIRASLLAIETSNALELKELSYFGSFSLNERRRALSLAAKAGSFEILDVLNLQENEKRHVMFKAAESGNLEILKRSLKDQSLSPVCYVMLHQALVSFFLKSSSYASHFQENKEKVEIFCSQLIDELTSFS